MEGKDKDRAIAAAVVAGILGIVGAVIVAFGPSLLSSNSSPPLAAAPVTGQPAAKDSTSASSKAAPARTVFPSSYVGSWSGKYLQDNGRIWQMDLKIAPNSTRGSITYPQLKCSGTWTLNSIDGSTLAIRETITVNTKRCNAFGTVYLTAQPDGSLEMQYTPSDDKYQASAKLTRD